eukprot:2080110-Amphidinium_carterae.1
MLAQQGEMRSKHVEFLATAACISCGNMASVSIEDFERLSDLSGVPQLRMLWNFQRPMLVASCG